MGKKVGIINPESVHNQTARKPCQEKKPNVPLTERKSLLSLALVDSSNLIAWHTHGLHRVHFAEPCNSGMVEWGIMGTESEIPVSPLLDQPRVAKLMLSLYEGLARACDAILASGAPDDSSRQNLQRYRDLYFRHVGVDVTQRDDLRRLADQKIEQESLSVSAL